MEIITSIAPDADYYIATSNSASHDFAAIEALLNADVNIISASLVIGNDQHSSYGTTAKWLDHIAYHHDVHFVKSSGNSGGGNSSTSGPTSGAMSYNIFAVGNLNVNGTTYLSDDVIHSASSYYTGTEFAYKPDLCAPGTGIRTNFTSGADTFTGTSAAAPQVAGAIALLCEQRPALRYQQSTVKAILTASVNFSSPRRYTPSDANYRIYGAGLLDCVGACFVTGYYRYVTSNFPASLNSTSVTHTFTVTSSDSRIRVALAFNRKSVPNSTHDGVTLGEATDLNIYVRAPDNTIVGSSITTKNNVEIVDFVPTQTGTYTIIINREDYTNETVYYGLAWR